MSSGLCSVLGAAGLAVALSGCSGQDVSRAFGLDRSVPDEYTVTTRAPLSMPPSSELAPPSAGASRPQDESERMQALETLSPDVALHGTSGENSEGQSLLITEASEASTQPNQGELGAAGDKSYVDQLLFWKGGGAGTVVDGEAENRRLKANAALGNAPTTGATPTQRAKKSKVLGIF